MTGTGRRFLTAHGGAEVTSPIKIPFAGAEFWELSEKAQIVAFEIVKTGCPTVGSLGGCQLATAKAEGLPWS